MQPPVAEPFYEPLSARDAWFLYAERPSTPLDLGTVYVFEGGSRVPGGRGALDIEETIRERIHLASYKRGAADTHRIAAARQPSVRGLRERGAAGGG